MVKEEGVSKKESEESKKKIPEIFVPNKIFNYTFTVIFVLVVISSILNFPLSKMLAGDSDFSIDVGIPYAFFQLSLQNPERIPINSFGLVIDMIIYLIIAYLVNLMINIILDSSFYNELFKKKPKEQEKN